MFKFIAGNGLYLSGVKTTTRTKYVDLYSDIRLVSASNLPFSGIAIEKYTIKNDNMIELYLPEYLSAGIYDIIFCGPAGYDKLSNYTNTPFTVIENI